MKDNTIKGDFTIFKTPNAAKVAMTVALPAFNAKKIIWLSLESLVRQKIEDGVYWELIIAEEYGESRDIVQSYIDRLIKVNCARLQYIFINPRTEGIISNSYLLLEKWVRMAIIALPTSHIYILMACDIYAHPNRLMVHYNHFKNKDCIISTQPVGPFYNILTAQMFIYDGILLNKKVKARQLNMAFKLEYIKHVKIINKKRAIDSYIQREIIRQMNGSYNNAVNVFYDTSDNWKYGFDTDGYNNISKSRRLFYRSPEDKVDQVIENKNKSSKDLKKILTVFWCLPLHNSVKKEYKYEGLNKYIPKDIINKLDKMIDQ